MELFFFFKGEQVVGLSVNPALEDQWTAFCLAWVVLPGVKSSCQQSSRGDWNVHEPSSCTKVPSPGKESVMLTIRYSYSLPTMSGQKTAPLPPHHSLPSRLEHMRHEGVVFTAKNLFFTSG